MLPPWKDWFVAEGLGTPRLLPSYRNLETENLDGEQGDTGYDVGGGQGKNEVPGTAAAMAMQWG